MKKESIISVALNLVVVVLLVVVLVQQNFRYSQLDLICSQLAAQREQIDHMHTEMTAQQGKIDQMDAEREENQLITRVVNIRSNGEGGSQIISLTPQGWLDFMRTYPGKGCVFSNFDFEDLFNFTEIDPQYPDEVKEFLEKEKTSFTSWTPNDRYDGCLYGGDFIMDYFEQDPGIKVIFRNDKDDVQVKYVFQGAQHTKEVHIEGTTRYYFVFESKENNVIAIKFDSDGMTMYQLSPKK